jgi:hypothetical protein
MRWHSPLQKRQFCSQFAIWPRSLALAINLHSIPISLYIPGHVVGLRSDMFTAGGLLETDARSLRILIADDQPIIRKHVRRILQELPRLNVCGEAYDGLEAISEAQRVKPGHRRN